MIVKKKPLDSELGDNKKFSCSKIYDLRGRLISDSLAYWRRHNLFPFLKKGENLKDVNTSQLAWIIILDYLRELSFKVKNTQLFCKNFFKDGKIDNLTNLLEESSQKNILLIIFFDGTFKIAENKEDIDSLPPCFVISMRNILNQIASSVKPKEVIFFNLKNPNGKSIKLSAPKKKIIQNIVSLRNKYNVIFLEGN